jgi:uncharacterized protein
MRVLMWLILIVLVIFALRKKSQRPPKVANPPSAMPEAAARSSLAETMVCCERCQVYIPASEAVMRGEKSYCCAAHADQA